MSRRFVPIFLFWRREKSVISYVHRFWNRRKCALTSRSKVRNFDGEHNYGLCKYSVVLTAGKCRSIVKSTLVAEG